jgi:hypothetical protein
VVCQGCGSWCPGSLVWPCLQKEPLLAPACCLPTGRCLLPEGCWSLLLPPPQVRTAAMLETCLAVRRPLLLVGERPGAAAGRPCTWPLPAFRGQGAKVAATGAWETLGSLALERVGTSALLASFNGAPAPLVAVNGLPAVGHRLAFPQPLPLPPTHTPQA